ncbi:hypothetical protein KPL71_020414 [Citrus sinensis]|uniref:Uncharacterized protein n=1 Tax=Citrus sinensis TaxID=2711 RepID=A0ACB8J7U8_CITSI|nr:hypothetical protein KPL71_020414 [Citrus sinensis]
MATATMATAAGAAALLYYTLNRKLMSSSSRSDDDDDANGGVSTSHTPLGIDRVSHRLIQAPATWLETISTLSETLRFTYSETLGKWPIGDLAFGINFLLKRQGNLHVDSIFGGKDSVRLQGPGIIAEFRYMLNLLTLCWHFSKKTFPLFLEETGYAKEHVLLQEPKAGVLVPFHHTVVCEGGVSNLVLGYAHCGMVAAARWIAKLSTPCLIEALDKYPGYKLKIVGHSLGGGTAALLTYVLRERKELSTATCVTFAPGACMTWELAESGNDFITSVINGADLVPTFSAASVDDLRAEVTASAWLNDLRNQIERTRILSTVYRSASALGSHLPSIASARAKVAGAGAILRPVSNGTQVVMRRAQSMAQAAWSPALHLSSWSCMGPRHRRSSSKDEGVSSESSCKTETCEPLISSPKKTTTLIEDMQLPVSSSLGMEWTTEIGSCSDEVHPHSDDVVDLDDSEDHMGHNSHEDRVTEVELWQQLEHELYERTEAEGGDVTKEIREEEAAAIAEVGEAHPDSSASEIKEAHRFFPPGKIMHIVTLHLDSDSESSESDSPTSSNSDSSQPPAEDKVQVFLTPRSLYSKLRLSQTMVSDHFMPVYRRQIERLIKNLEKEQASDDYNRREHTEGVVL